MSPTGDRLRAAADKLDARSADAWAGGDWKTWLAFANRAGNLPAGTAPWIAMMGPHRVTEPLTMWLRSEAIQFETSPGRGSPYGYPSWHFASTVLNLSPTDGGFVA